MFQTAIGDDFVKSINKSARDASDVFANELEPEIEAARKKLEEITEEAEGLGVVPLAIEGADKVAEGVTKITAAAPKVFNITIDSLIETFNVNTKNMQEGSARVKEKITQALLEGVSDTQLIME